MHPSIEDGVCSDASVSTAASSPASAAGEAVGSFAAGLDKDAESDDVDDDEALCCPITMELFRDPVVIASGHTYDRESIEQHFKAGNKKDPLTNQPLPSTFMLTNWDKRRQVQDYLDRRGPSFTPTGWDSRELDPPKKLPSTVACARSGSSGRGVPDMYIVVFYTMCAMSLGFMLQSFASVTLVVRWPGGEPSGQGFQGARTGRNGMISGQRHQDKQFLARYTSTATPAELELDENSRLNYTTIHAPEQSGMGRSTVRDDAHEGVSSTAGALAESAPFAAASGEEDYLGWAPLLYGEPDTRNAVEAPAAAASAGRAAAEADSVLATSSTNSNVLGGNKNYTVVRPEDVVADPTHPYLENPVHQAVHMLFQHSDSPQLLTFTLSYLANLPHAVFDAFLLGKESRARRECGDAAAGDLRRAAGGRGTTGVRPERRSWSRDEDSSDVAADEVTSTTSSRSSHVNIGGVSTSNGSGLLASSASVASRGGSRASLRLKKDGRESRAPAVQNVNDTVVTNMRAQLDEMAIETHRNGLKEAADAGAAAAASVGVDGSVVETPANENEKPAGHEQVMAALERGEPRSQITKTILDVFADHLAKKDRAVVSDPSSSSQRLVDDSESSFFSLTPFERTLAQRGDLYFSVPLSYMATAFVTGRDPFQALYGGGGGTTKRSTCPARWCGKMMNDELDKKLAAEQDATHQSGRDANFALVPSSRHPTWGLVVPPTPPPSSTSRTDAGKSLFNTRSPRSLKNTDQSKKLRVSGGQQVLKPACSTANAELDYIAGDEGRDDSYRRLVEHAIVENLDAWTLEKATASRTSSGTASDHRPKLPDGTPVQRPPRPLFRDALRSVPFSHPLWGQISSRPSLLHELFLGRNLQATNKSSAPTWESDEITAPSPPAQVHVSDRQMVRGLTAALLVLRRFSRHSDLLHCLSPKITGFLRRVGVLVSFGMVDGRERNELAALFDAVMEQRGLTCGPLCGTCVSTGDQAK